MSKPGVLRAWENQIDEAELLDAPQSLEGLRSYQLPLRLGEVDRTVERV